MNVGTRGGSPDVLSRGKAEELMREWKPDEFGHLQARIMLLAADGFHGEQLEAVELSERNMIGAAVGGLVRQGLIRATGDHVASTSPASHRRRSYVYGLTGRGRDLLENYGAQSVEAGGGRTD